MREKTPYKSKHQDFEDKRKYPRIVVKCPVSVKLPDNTAINARVHDISPDGVQLRYSPDTAESLKQLGIGSERQEDCRLDLKITLPFGGKGLDITVKARVVYVVKTTDNEYAAGLQFTTITKANQEILNRFVEISMEPK